MHVIYTSKFYDAAQSYDRYVRRDTDGDYRWCEVGEMYDVRQGTVDASELPHAIREAADKASGKFPAYVTWPIT